MKIPQRQRGALNLYWVAIFSAAVAALAMVALMSMRGDRNLFAEGADKAKAAFAASDAQKALKAATDGATGTDNRMKKCIIRGKTVISNTDCPADNKTTKVIVIPEGNVADAVKAPVEPAQKATSNPAIDKIIEKQLH
jgi:fructose-specific phosphotransferase system component IIB